MTPVELALSQVGAVEVPRGSNRGPEIDLYTGGRAEPHCAHFVAWLFRSCGRPIPGDIQPSPTQHNPLASVTFMERVFKDHDWLFMEPQVGDLVFYSDRGLSDRGPGRHVGIVVAVGTEVIETVESNWGDAVAHRKVRRNNPKIVGFGRVP